MQGFGGKRIKTAGPTPVKYFVGVLALIFILPLPGYLMGAVGALLLPGMGASELYISYFMGTLCACGGFVGVVMLFIMFVLYPISRL